MCISDSNMAAIEIQLNYKDGIVAYINGAEVYRDNMADGTPSSNTPATGSYTSYGYHGLIRPANDVTVSSVLAVEVHPMDLTTTRFIQFDGFLSLMAGLSSTNNCFVVPNDMAVTTTGFTNPTYACLLYTSPRFELKWVGYVFQIMIKMSAFSSLFMGLFVCIFVAFLSGRCV